MCYMQHFCFTTIKNNCNFTKYFVMLKFSSAMVAVYREIKKSDDPAFDSFILDCCSNMAAQYGGLCGRLASSEDIKRFIRQ